MNRLFRPASFFLGTWYFFLGLGVPFVEPHQRLDTSSAARTVPPRSPASAEAALEAGFRCAGHSCGCGDAEACRRHCCCFPSAEHREPAPPEQGVSYLALSRCRGEEPGAPVGSSPQLGFHLPVEVASLPREPSLGRAIPFKGFTRRVVSADPPDKIPI